MKKINIRNLCIAVFSVVGYTISVMIRIEQTGNQLWNLINLWGIALFMIWIIYTSLPNYIQNKQGEPSVNEKAN